LLSSQFENQTSFLPAYHWVSYRPLFLAEQVPVLVVTGDSARLLSIIFGTLLLLLNTGCTSLGHEGRAQPQFEQSLKKTPRSVAVVGSGELAIAVELILISEGV